MNLCNKSHPEVCFEGRDCPLCDTIREKDIEIDNLLDEVADLKDTIDKLKDES